MSARTGIPLLLCLLAPAWGAAADKLYYFVDENGVQHYSNVPADPRYKPLGPSDAASVVSSPPVLPPRAPATVAPLAPVPIIPSAVPLPDDDDEDR